MTDDQDLKELIDIVKEIQDVHFDELVLTNASREAILWKLTNKRDVLIKRLDRKLRQRKEAIVLCKESTSYSLPAKEILKVLEYN